MGFVADSLFSEKMLFSAGAEVIFYDDNLEFIQTVELIGDDIEDRDSIAEGILLFMDVGPKLNITASDSA